MGVGRSQNFDAAIFNKYATHEYYLSRGASGNVYGPIQWNDMQLAIKQNTFAAGKVTEELKKDIETKKDILASIEHEHLLKIHFVDISRLPKSMFIVMEFAAGGSLQQALKSLGGSGQNLPISVVREWAKQIAEGMLYLHQKSIVHRDLKSSNILLMKPYDIRELYTEMTLKIGDFDEVKDHDHTTTMSFVGTVAYMAPEVIVEQRFSKGSDVWSYGVVAWEMVTGDTPHKGLEPTAIMHKALKGELDNLKIEKSFPLFLKQLLERCLEPNLRKRASFHDVVSILQGCLEPILKQRASFHDVASTLQAKYKYNSDPVLIHSIEGIAAKETNKWINGLAILDNELFVVTGCSSAIEVYDSIELSFSRRMHLKELIDPREIASCNISKCLYIFDRNDFLKSDEILRIDSNAKLIKNWSVGRCYGNTISITDESNVIVSVSFDHVIREFSPDGQLISEINPSLDADTQNIRHTIKLSNGNFLFSCCSGHKEPYRVCIVDAVGKLTRSFGGKYGPNNIQMKHPVYLSVDGNGFVFVADLFYSQVLLLDSNLRFQREILSKEKHGLQYPSRIILDESNGRILVADEVRILIFQIKE